MRTSETHPIRANFLPEEEVGLPGLLGMTFAPGVRATALRERWERDLAADLRGLQEGYGMSLLVSLIEDHEYDGYGIPRPSGDRVGEVEIRRFPIVDMSVPEEAKKDEYDALIEGIIGRLERGDTVVVHCLAGLGRTGTVAACILVALGHPAQEAIDAVRRARTGTIQTHEQEEFVRRFAQTRAEREGKP